MKLFIFECYADWSLRVCENQESAEKLFEQLYNFKVNGDSRRVEELNEIEGYNVSLIKKDS